MLAVEPWIAHELIAPQRSLQIQAVETVRVPGIGSLGRSILPKEEIEIAQEKRC